MIELNQAEYQRRLLRFIDEPDDEARELAYGFGRAAMALGVGLLELTGMHAEAMRDQPRAVVAGERAWQCFQEVIAAFEMALRGFREVNASLVAVAAALESRVEARTAELSRAQEDLRGQRDVLARVLESMSDGLAVVDAQARIVLFNSAGEQLLGAPPADRDCTRWIGGFSVCERDGLTPMPLEATPIVRAMRGEDVRDVEIAVQLPDTGRQMRLSVSAAPLRDAAGSLNGAVSVFRDITSRHAADEAARQGRDRLAHGQKLEALGQLAGGVAHDFNNLLAVISSYSNLLTESLPANSNLMTDVAAITKAADSAATLTRQLLAFSRQRVLQYTDLDLNLVVRDVVSMLRRTIGAQIEVTTELDPALGFVQADRGQIEQALMNLAVNARDAMEGGGRLSIRTLNHDAALPGPDGVIRRAPAVLLTVSDTGAGMDEETIQRIYEPFFTTKEFGRGTGLGLATTYGIVQQCAGAIDVVSQPGAGTSFTLAFPRVAHRSAVDDHTRPPEAKGGAETILLVEDDDALRLVASRVLRGSGYTVLIAANASEALAICAATPGDIDLVLSDVLMPGTSGAELARTIRALRPATRVLLMSGYSVAGIHQYGELPADISFLEKPFSAATLRLKVREVLSGRAGG